MPEAENTKKCRGIIVMDSTELRMLSGSYKKGALVPHGLLDQLKPKTGSYLDILTVLAQQGYRIIIPEMVMQESANMLAGKKQPVSIADAFARQSRLAYSSQQHVREFCGHAAEKHFPNIEIMPEQLTHVAGETREYQSYLRALHVVCDEVYDEGRGDYNMPMARNGIKRVNKEYEGKKKDAGEQHAEDIIADIIEHRPEEDKTPIFLCTSDLRAQERIGSKNFKAPVSVLTTYGILHALENIPNANKVSLLNSLGLRGDMREHWEHMDKTNPRGHSYEAAEHRPYDFPLNLEPGPLLPFNESAQGMSAAAQSGFTARFRRGSQNSGQAL